MSERTVSAATILVADDNWANLDLLSGLLQVEGYEVLCVMDGKQALQTLRSRPIDLILLDVMMPEQDGIETCRQLRELLQDYAADRGLVRAAVELLGRMVPVEFPFNTVELE